MFYFMKTRIWGALTLAAALLFPSQTIQAQMNVTATVVDPLGIPYANGTYSIQLTPTGDNPTVNGNSIGGTFNGTMDASGRFNVTLWPNASILPAGTTWLFTICTNPGGVPLPLGTGNQCTPPTTVTIVAPGPQNLSDTLSAVAPQLTSIKLGGSSIPSGSILMISSGACPAGFTESATLNGTMPFGTLAANGDVGTTGGSNTITPTVASLTAAAQAFSGNSATTSAVSAGTPAGTNGTVSFTPAGTNGTVSFTPAGTNNAPAISWPAGVPTFAGNAGTVPAQTFSGTPFSSVINHTHTVTVTYNVQGGTTAATTGTHVMTSTATGGSARAPTAGDVVSATTANPGGGVASITPAGTNSTAAFTPAGTVAWPAGVPTHAAATFSGSAGTVPAPTFSGSLGTIPAETFTGSALGTHTHTVTAAGTNGASAVTGTLNSFDNRPAFVKVIFCQKN